MKYPEIWAMFYASLVSIQGHPGNKTPRSLEDLATEADAMYGIFLMRKEGVWPRG